MAFVEELTLERNERKASLMGKEMNRSRQVEAKLQPESERPTGIVPKAPFHALRHSDLSFQCFTFSYKQRIPRKLIRI